MPKVCAVLLNWKGAADTLACLQSLIAARPGPTAIVVCDNASDDDSLNTIARGLKALCNYEAGVEEPNRLESGAERPPVILLPQISNRGFAAGNNAGIRYALARDFSFIWLLNNDTVVHPDSLGHLLQSAADYPGVGIWGCTVVDYDQPARVQCAGGCSYNPLTTVFRPYRQGCNLASCFRGSASRLDFIYGAAFFVHREVWQRVGLLDERFFLFYEELDFCLRARRAGYTTAWCRPSIVRHKQSRSLTRASFRQVVSRHENLSTFLFTAKHYPLLLPLVLPIRFAGKLIAAWHRSNPHLLTALLEASWIFLQGIWKKREGLYNDERE